MSESKQNRVRLFISTLPVEKHAFFRVIQNWEEIESLKNEKKSWNSPVKVLEFCFPTSVRTLLLLSCHFRKILSGTYHLHPDQDQHSVGPDLGPNCLQRQRTNVAASKKGVI